MENRRSFDESILEQLRRMPSDQVLLRRLAIHLKPDRTDVPRKSPESRRWHLLTERGDFKILTTGSRWFDTRDRPCHAPARRAVCRSRETAD